MKTGKKKKQTVKTSSSDSSKAETVTGKSKALKWGLFVFAGCWMFFLGIMVGRGTIALNEDADSVQRKLADLDHAQTALNEKRFKIDMPKAGAKANLDFYDKLRQSKQPAKKQVKTPPKKKVQKPVKKPAVPPKTVVAKKKPVKPSPRPKPAATPPAPQPVKKQAAAPAPVKKAASPRATAPTPAKPYTIQVASVRDRAGADKIVRNLNQKGVSAYRIRADIPGKGVWYRVRVGGYTTLAQAKSSLARLKKKAVTGFVIKQ